VILKLIDLEGTEDINKAQATAIYQDALISSISKYIRKNDLKTLTKYIIDSKDRLLSHITYKEIYVLKRPWKKNKHICIIFKNKIIMYYITEVNLEDYMKIDFYGGLPISYNGLQFMDWAKDIIYSVDFKTRYDLDSSISKFYFYQLDNFLDYEPTYDNNLSAFLRLKAIIKLKNEYDKEWRKFSQEEQDMLIESEIEDMMKVMLDKLEDRVKDGVDNIMSLIRDLLFKNLHVIKIRKQTFNMTLLKAIYDEEDYNILFEYGKRINKHVYYCNIIFSNLHLLLFDSLWVWPERDKYKAKIRSYIKLDKKKEDFNVKIGLVLENSNVILKNNHKFVIKIDLSTNLFRLAMSRVGMINVLFSAHTIISTILSDLHIRIYSALCIFNSISI